MYYGVRTRSGFIHAESHWTSLDHIVGSGHGFDITSISEWGVLLCRETADDEWQEVEL